VIGLCAGAAFLIAIVNSNDAMAQEEEVLFHSQGELHNVACDAPARSVVFSLLNTSPALTARLKNIKVTPLGDDNSNIMTVFEYVGIADNCITYVSSDKVASGSIKPFGLCKIIISVTPPNCVPGEGPTHATIDQKLFIDFSFDTVEGHLTAAIKAQVTTLGSFATFAALAGETVTNTINYGLAKVTGDLAGYTVQPNLEDFNLEGQLYGTSRDPVTSAAYADAKAALAMFNKNVPLDCPMMDLKHPTEPVLSGVYCLVTDEISGPITLSGAGDFVFNGGFILAQPGTHFIYEDGATPEKVYWVTHTMTILSQIDSAIPSAIFDGTVLSSGLVSLNGSPPEFIDNPLATVHGRLFSQDANINLFGSTVKIPSAPSASQ